MSQPAHLKMVPTRQFVQSMLDTIEWPDNVRRAMAAMPFGPDKPSTITDEEEIRRILVDVLLPPAGFDRPTIKVVSNAVIITLGLVHGFPARLVRYHDGVTEFRWGCRRIASPGLARQHWPNDRSIYSGEQRPHASRLIAWAMDVAGMVGWRW